MLEALPFMASHLSLWNHFLFKGITHEMPAGERNTIAIIRGASLFILGLGPVFAVVNWLQGYPQLTAVNVSSTSLGLICLLLVRKHLVTTAAVLLTLGCAVLFLISGLLVNNGMEHTLLLGMLAAVFMFDSFAARAPLVALNAAVFLFIKIHQYQPGPEGFPPVRYGINIVIFLLSYAFILEVIRAIHRKHRQAIEQQNAELSESRRRLDKERTELVALTRQLQVANQAKERLFSLVAHDLRGPVGSLKSALGLLISRDLTAQDFQGMVAEFKVEVDLAYECLDTLLQWSAKQLHEIKPVLAPVPLNEVAQDALALLSNLAAYKGIALHNKVPAEAQVWADQTQVSSIFRNLLSNALKFTPSGGSVEVSAREEGAHWSVAVTDTGIGMTPEQVRRISQSQSCPSNPGTDNEKGFGLGLHLCFEFVRSNQGTLSVESQSGRGTTFRFTLPKAPRATPPPAAA